MNKTNKLTIIGVKGTYYNDVDEYGEDSKEEEEGTPYFFVITAYRGDGLSRREPKGDDYYNEERRKDVKFWKWHALNPEDNEIITRAEAPCRDNDYYKIEKEDELKSIYKKGKELQYQAFNEYVKKNLSDLGREYDKLEIIGKDKSDNEEVSDIQYVMVSNKGKFGVIRVDNSNKIEKCNEKSVEEYRKEIIEKDFIKNFKAEIIKDINNQNYSVPQEITEYRKAFISRKRNNENLGEIIKATEKIKHKVEIDKEGNKLSTIILGNKEYKILEPNLKGISDEKYSSYVTESYPCIQKFKRLEADLDGMRGNNPDGRLNKKLANYVKTKESEGFNIPGDKFKSFLSELGKETGVEKIEGQLLMLMYLTGMDGNYWYSTDGGRIKCEYPTFRSNSGNVSGGLLLMSSKELKE